MSVLEHKYAISPKDSVMTVFTKKVSITYNSAEDQAGSPTNPFTVSRFDKMSDLINAGKTNGIVQVKPLTSAIKFVDQESAEEYLNFVLALATTNNVNIVSSSITDI